jgi:hypothetical protein
MEPLGEPCFSRRKILSEIRTNLPGENAISN